MIGRIYLKKRALIEYIMDSLKQFLEIAIGEYLWKNIHFCFEKKRKELGNYSIQIIWGNRDDVQSWSSFAYLNPSGMWIENIKEAHINYRKKNKKMVFSL